MAKNGNKNNANDESPRVYKVAPVHKRRAERRTVDGNPSGDKSSAYASSGNRASTEKASAQSSPAKQPVAKVPSSNKASAKKHLNSKRPLPVSPDAETEMLYAIGEPAGPGKLHTEGAAKQALGEGSRAQAGASEDTVALEAIAERDVDNAIGENEEGEVASEIDAGADADADTEADAGADTVVDAETESEEDAEEDAAKHAKPKKRRWKLVVGIIFGIIVAAMLVTVGYIAGNRWVRYDDAADMQGRWYVYGTDVPLRFENNSIVINDNTSYAYHIDPTAKTIEYTFGNLAGRGRYWFNAERDVLIITDGADYTMWSTLLDDVSYDLGCLFGKNELPAAESSIVLSRSVVQSSSKPAASTTAGENASESASSSKESGKDSADESTDTLIVSDIMMEEPKEGQDGQNGQSDQYGTYGQ